MSLAAMEKSLPLCQQNNSIKDKKPVLHNCQSTSFHKQSSCSVQPIQS